MAKHDRGRKRSVRMRLAFVGVLAVAMLAAVTPSAPPAAAAPTCEIELVAEFRTGEPGILIGAWAEHAYVALEGSPSPSAVYDGSGAEVAASTLFQPLAEGPDGLVWGLAGSPFSLVRAQPEGTVVSVVGDYGPPVFLGDRAWTTRSTTVEILDLQGDPVGTIDDVAIPGPANGRPRASETMRSFLEHEGTVFVIRESSRWLTAHDLDGRLIKTLPMPPDHPSARVDTFAVNDHGVWVLDTQTYVHWFTLGGTHLISYLPDDYPVGWVGAGGIAEPDAVGPAAVLDNAIFINHQGTTERSGPVGDWVYVDRGPAGTDVLIKAVTSPMELWSVGGYVHVSEVGVDVYNRTVAVFDSSGDSVRRVPDQGDLIMVEVIEDIVVIAAEHGAPGGGHEPRIDVLSSTGLQLAQFDPPSRFVSRVFASGDRVFLQGEADAQGRPEITVLDISDCTKPVYAGAFWDDDDIVFETDIEWLATEGITKGCNPPVNDMFCPDDAVTRGQMAAFLTRALNLTDDGRGNSFIDDDGSIFEDDIAKLAAAGITKGCNPPVNDQFCPNDNVTRGQMAAFLVRALSYTDDGGGDLFVDDDDSIFETDIDRLATAGVTRGCNPPVNDQFCPTSNVTRGQMAAFLHRALG